jgi:membrane protein DedA with SNARE-associated domain
MARSVPQPERLSDLHPVHYAPRVPERAARFRPLYVLLAAVLVPIVPFAVIGELPGERWLEAVSHDALRFGATGAALLAGDVLLPIPSSVIGALLGGRLGFALGFGWAFSGLWAGHMIGYGCGRLLPSRFRSELPRAPTLAIVFLSRPVPVLAEAVAIAAGVERMSVLHYSASVALGNAVYAAAMAGNGAALLPDGLAGPGLIAPMAVPVLGYALWRWLARRGSA